MEREKILENYKFFASPVAIAIIDELIEDKKITARRKDTILFFLHKHAHREYAVQQRLKEEGEEEKYEGVPYTSTYLIRVFGPNYKKISQHFIYCSKTHTKFWEPGAKLPRYYKTRNQVKGPKILIPPSEFGKELKKLILVDEARKENRRLGTE